MGKQATSTQLPARTSAVLIYMIYSRSYSGVGRVFGEEAASFPGLLVSGRGREVEEGGRQRGEEDPSCALFDKFANQGAGLQASSRRWLCRGICLLLPGSPLAPSDKVMRCKSLVCLTSCCPTAREPRVLRGWERRLINAKRHSLMWQ